MVNEHTMTAITLMTYFIVITLGKILTEEGNGTQIITIDADEIKIVSDGVNETKIIAQGNITIETQGADEINFVEEESVDTDDDSDEQSTTSSEDVTKKRQNNKYHTYADKHTTHKGDIFQNYGYPRPKDLPILNRKIFKGARMTIREHPYVVSIRRQYSYYLPGTLVSHNVVLTVAHPLYGVSIEELGVVAGENYSDRGTSLNPVMFVVIHEEFDQYTLANDISILRTYDEFFPSTNVKPIRLHYGPPHHVGSQAFVTGWGRCDFTGKELCLPRSNKYYPREVLDPMLRTVTFTITNNSFCEDYEANEVPLKPGMMCMGVSRSEEYMTSCMGVPGAPLVVHGRLSGILSWGVGCGYTFDMPLVYVDLYYYKKWLIHNAEVLKMSKEEITIFHLATKAYVMQKYVNQTKMDQKRSTRRPESNEHDLQMHDIDLKLATIMGTVYDVRDFINNGSYHKQKQWLYSKIKQSYNHLSMTSNYSNVKAMPFLNKNKIRKLGFHIKEDGTISEVEDY